MTKINRIQSFIHWQRKYKIILILSLFFLIVQYLNFTGFCYSEFRYLPKQEIVDAYLFGNNHRILTLLQKKEDIHERGGEYPGCCWVENEPWIKGWMAKTIDKIRGNYRFSVYTLFFDRNAHSKKYPIREEHYSVNACGKNAIWYTGTTRSMDRYKDKIRHIQDLWEKD